MCVDGVGGVCYGFFVLFSWMEDGGVLREEGWEVGFLVVVVARRGGEGDGSGEWGRISYGLG